MRVLHEVFIHGHGRKVIRRGPMEGCLDFPSHKWTRINKRLLGLKKATELANNQSCHSVVVLAYSVRKVFDNGKQPYIPEGYRSLQALTAFDK